MLDVNEVKRFALDDIQSPWAGDARLYKLSEEVTVKPDIEYPIRVTTEYIVVSAVEFGDNEKQTYIFPADEDGHPLDMMHLKGSIKGSLDHTKAIRRFIGQHMSLPTVN